MTFPDLADFPSAKNTSPSVGYEARGSGVPTIMKFKWLALAGLAAIWLAAAAGFASTGPFLLDELIYSTMIERFATSGALTIVNGYANHPSNSLLLKFLVAGPIGTVPQYPAGYAILAAPFLLAGGFHGVLVMNALASILTLVIIYNLATVLFEDRNLAVNAALIFGFASFATEYALGLWPHATSVFFVALASYLVVSATTAEGPKSLILVALGGLTAALGVTVRVDVLIVAPALAVWLFGATRRPFAMVPAFLLGMCPGLLFSAWLNHLKFGTWAPVTYGHSPGAANFQAYLPLLPVGLIGLVAVASTAHSRVRQVLLGRRGLLIVGCALAFVLVLPYTRDAGFRLLKGMYVLLVDLQAYPNLEHALGAQPLPGGPVLMFGLLKKALFQSLPYLGFALLPLAMLFQPRQRSALAICFLVPAAWFAPFAYFTWYGGSASNMRYFLPALPFLSILAAFSWKEILAQKADRRSLLILAGVLAGMAAFIMVRLWNADPEAAFFRAHLVIPDSLLACGAAIALLWIAIPALRGPLKWSACSIFAIGLVWAFYSSAIYDTAASQIRRTLVATANAQYSTIEKNAHVVTVEPELFLFHLRRGTGTLAMYEKDWSELDFSLIDDSLRHGRPVYAHTRPIADAIEKHGDGKTYVVLPRSAEQEDLFTVQRAGPENELQPPAVQ